MVINDMIDPNHTQFKSFPYINNQQEGTTMEPRIVTLPNIKIPKTSKRSSKSFPRWAKIVLIVIGVFVGISLIIGIPTYLSATKVKASLLVTKLHAQAAYDGLKSQNLAIAKTELDAAKTSLDETTKNYQSISFLRFTPFAWHYDDGKKALAAGAAGIEAGQLVINAIEPYADVIGFQGQGSFVGGTAEDRIVKIIETIDKINPSLDQVNEKLTLINQELAGINPKRYPFITIEGKSVENLIGSAQQLVGQANSVMAQLRPALTVLPDIAGLSSAKKYLILFQNDAELRPTGGFVTAYAVLKVEKGKVTPEKSSDIYDLDSKFNKRLTPPDIVKKLLKVNTWHLRDMNLSPDFKVSMDQFVSYYNELPGETKVDGVIAVDTKLLTDLVRSLGPIEVPGFGTFSAENDPRCDCPQVFYALEEIADRPTYMIKTDRKAILGPLMQTILVKAYGAPKQTWPSLFSSIWTNLNEKHVLMYFFNEDFQNAAEMVGVAGRIKTYDADYLHINDANFGGAKSNMFVTQTIEQEVTKTDTGISKTIVITYKNPRKGDNCNLEAGKLCLNGKMPNWTRIYVPKEAVVSEVLGFDNDTVKESFDLDKKVIEGYFELNPESQVKIKLTVQLPLIGDQYRLLIQKQPGTKNSATTIHLNGVENTFDLVTDTEVKMKW